MIFAKITANHEIFVLDNYPRQNSLLEDLGDYFENYKDCQNRRTNVKATMTEWNLDLPNQEFIHFKRTIYSVAKQIKLYWACPFKINTIWANIYRKGDYTIPHDHDPDRYSFVYFLKSKPNFSPLLFEDVNLKNKKKKWRVIKPIEGRLVIFPGFLKHKVPVHIHNETRITISGNFSQ
tara:strand:- start:374 stop:907 length:534 start_codon:yes stop_codon:yes gene_type:complete